MSFKGHKAVTHHDGGDEESWHTYVCGYCGTKVSGAVISSYEWSERRDNNHIKWLLCTNCALGSVWVSGYQYPGVLFGPEIEGLPEDVSAAYDEARSCMSVNAHAAAELVCRRILVHVAVEKGSKEGLTFTAYLSHLEAEGYITPPMKVWVELIRKHGNKSTHELEAPSRQRAESTVMFTAELLRLVYEMNHMASRFGPKSNERKEGGA